jgi:hypothetical protein
MKRINDKKDKNKHQLIHSKCLEKYYYSNI